MIQVDPPQTIAADGGKWVLNGVLRVTGMQPQQDKQMSTDREDLRQQVQVSLIRAASKNNVGVEKLLESAEQGRQRDQR